MSRYLGLLVFFVIHWGFSAYSQGYSYVIPSPRLAFHLVAAKDSVPAYLQVRTSQATCVHLYSNFENIDTSFELAQNSVANLEMPKGISSASLPASQAPIDQLIFLDASLPVALSLYFNVTRPIDTMAFPHQPNSGRCPEIYRSYGSDILPFKRWGSSYKMNLPLTFMNGFRLSWISCHLFGYDNQDINLRIPDSLFMLFPSSFFSAGCQLISQGVSGGRFYSDTLLHLNRNIQRFYQVEVGPTRGWRESGYSLISLQNKPFSFFPLFYSEATFAPNEPIISYDFYQGLEQLTPKDEADSLFYLPTISLADSLLVSVVFWEDSTYLYLNGNVTGPFSKSDVHRFFIDQNTVLKANFPVQCMVGTLPVKTSLYPQGTTRTFNTYDLGTAMRIDPVSRFIRKTVFQPVISPDSSVKAFVNLVCRTAAISSMSINGNPVPASQFQPFAADGTYSYANLLLDDNTVYVLENPDRFMALHYSRPVDTSGFVGLYSMILTETPEGTKEQRNIRYKTANDNTFQALDTVVLCQGGLLQLLPPEARHTTWYWQINGNPQKQRVSFASPDTLQVNTELPTGFYPVYISDSAGCLSDDTLYFELVSFIADLVSAEAELGCSGYFISLEGEVNGSASLSWQVDGEEVGTGSQLSFATPQGSGSFEVRLTATNGYCDTVINKTIKTADLREVSVPNVFTPNGDGFNDWFRLQNIEMYDGCYSLSIFNRWGRQVFESADTRECWGGAQLADGIYYYILRIGKEEITGHVTLFR